MGVDITQGKTKSNTTKISMHP